MSGLPPSGENQPLPEHLSPFSPTQTVMKRTDNPYFSTENYDFKPFSEDELALIMGGGDDELPLDFPSLDLLTEEES